MEQPRDIAFIITTTPIPIPSHVTGDDCRTHKVEQQNNCINSSISSAARYFSTVPFVSDNSTIFLRQCCSSAAIRWRGSFIVFCRRLVHIPTEASVGNNYLRPLLRTALNLSIRHRGAVVNNLFCSFGTVALILSIPTEATVGNNKFLSFGPSILNSQQRRLLCVQFICAVGDVQRAEFYGKRRVWWFLWKAKE